MKLVAYLRVSTREQASEGYGLEVQERAIRRWARANGHRIVKVYRDEGVSGAKPLGGRPGLAEALAAIGSRCAAGLVVRDLDRLAREVTVQEALLAEVWHRLESQVFTANAGEVLRDDPDDPMRTAMRKMAGVFHELDRLLIVKRLRDGRAAKKDAGGHAVGAYAYGEGPAGPIPEQQEALALMWKLQAQGHSTREIAAALQEGNHPTARGGKWSSPTVARILARNTNPAKESV